MTLSFTTPRRFIPALERLRTIMNTTHLNTAALLATLFLLSAGVTH